MQRSPTEAARSRLEAAESVDDELMDLAVLPDPDRTWAEAGGEVPLANPDAREVHVHEEVMVEANPEEESQNLSHVTPVEAVRNRDQL